MSRYYITHTFSVIASSEEFAEEIVNFAISAAMEHEPRIENHDHFKSELASDQENVADSIDNLPDESTVSPQERAHALDDPFGCFLLITFDTEEDGIAGPYQSIEERDSAVQFMTSEHSLEYRGPRCVSATPTHFATIVQRDQEIARLAQ